VASSACGVFGKSDVPQTTSAPTAPKAGTWPETPVAAFRPASAGACTEGYALSQNTCVHDAYRSRVGPLELDKQLAAYRAGAASPRVGGGPPPAAMPEPALEPDSDDPSKMPPDALTAKRKDGEQAKAKRLAELELLIRNAKIRAGESVDPLPAKPGDAPALDLMNPNARPTLAPGEVGVGDDAKKLQEMTEGLPPDVLKAVLVEIQRNGGTEMVSLDELKQLQTQIKEAEAEVQRK